MHSKLTLRLDDELIRQAKAFAKKRGKSVSQIVAGYFTMMEDLEKKEPVELTPIVRSLKGALRGAKIGVKDYHRYLEGKYL